MSSDSLEYLFRFAFLSLSAMIGRNLLVTKTKTKIFEKKYFSKMFKPVSTCAFKATVSQFLPLGYLHWGVLFIAVRSSAAHLGVLSLGGGSREVDLGRWISGGGWKFLSYLF